MDLWCCWRIYAFLNEFMMIYDACWLFFMVFGWCMMKQYWETYSLQTGQSLLNLKGKSLIQMGKFPLQIVKIPQGISFDGCTNHILLWYSWYSHPPTIFIYNYIYIPIRCPRSLNESWGNGPISRRHRTRVVYHGWCPISTWDSITAYHVPKLRVFVRVFNRIHLHFNIPVSTCRCRIKNLLMSKWTGGFMQSFVGMPYYPLFMWCFGICW